MIRGAFSESKHGIRWLRLLSFCLFCVLSCSPPLKAQNNSSAAFPSEETSGPVTGPTSPSAAGTSSNYALSQGDIVGVRVFREPDLDSQQRISKEGTIKFPLIGVVKISGYSADQAASRIADLLDPDYLVKPQVSVSVVAYAKQRFMILGQVANPGSYSIPDEQTLDILNAIAIAGGFTRLAEETKVSVTRLGGGEKKTYQLNVKEMMREGNGSRFVIQPNDVINVAERFF